MEKIVGGTEAKQEDWKFITLVTQNTDDMSSYCGGAIINDEYILSAAHCYKGWVEHRSKICEVLSPCLATMALIDPVE